MTAGPPCVVLLLGATGFIGERLLEALKAAGYQVVCGTRSGRAPSGCRGIAIDYVHDHAPGDWTARLQGIDVVINAVGILRETPDATFQALHVDAPVALFEACAEAGVQKVVQISALGADDEAASRYHVTKKRADDALAALAASWVIVQPSLVFGLGGRSAALFTQLAALPVIPLPGDGGQRVQPVHIDDLTEAIVRLIATNAYDRQRIPMVGPTGTTLRDMLGALRRALRLGDPHFVPVPLGLVRLVAAVGDRLRGVLLDRESLAMLIRGNVGSPQVISAVLDRSPRPVEAFIASGEVRAAANQARLGWLLPLLRATVGIVWIVTAIVSFGAYPVDESYAMLGRVGLTGIGAAVALYGAALLDLAFGLGVFLMRDRRWLWRAQMALIVGYSIIITIRLPEYWLHPFGPLLKNLPMLAAIILLHEFERPMDRVP